MTQNHFAYDDAARMVAVGTKAEKDARRATRWFRIFVVAQAAYALAFTLSIDVAGVGYGKAFAPFLLATLCIWTIAFRYQRSVPRHGLRNMGIAVATWFALYTLMLDPAFQLLQLSSPWWWVLAGVVSISPILACLFRSSRR
ncbi:hypothetical protein ABC195_01535 [Microbacterium sp. 2P01SA-2]|uniref:hypothetical protein n=1 Tax=unclassified Microbacterium TaxID=2609290 RepID=UPI0039A05169